MKISESFGLLDPSHPHELTREIMSTEMLLLTKQVITSVKLSMTYGPLQLVDSQLLEGLIISWL